MEPQPDSPTHDPHQHPITEKEIDEEDEDYYDDDDDEEEEPEQPDPATRTRTEQARMETLFKRLSTERVPVRVHDVIIRGNKKTKDSLIESQVEDVFRDVNSFQKLLRAASVANARLRMLDVFDSVNITLDSGPPELPGTANVVIEVSEAKSPVTGEFGVYTKPEVVVGFSWIDWCFEM